MNVVAPFHPVFAERIFNGTKLHEFRTRVPNDMGTGSRVYIYETAPTSKVVGYFTCGNIISGAPSEIWELCSESAGISEFEFLERFGEKGSISALQVWWPIRLPEPLGIEHFTKSASAPQSFVYVHRDPL